jgi:hypothetical protein
MTNIQSVDPSRVDTQGNSLQVTPKSLDAWLYEVRQLAQGIRDELETAKGEIAMKNRLIEELTARIEKLEQSNKQENRASHASKPLMSELAANLVKPGSQANIALLKAVTAYVKLSENNAKKAIFVGIAPSVKPTEQEKEADDLKAVKEIVSALNVQATIVKTQRIIPKVTEPGSTQPQPPPIVVEFADVATRNTVVASGKRLVTSNLKTVYIRPDRTPAEQAKFNRLYKERKETNDDLTKHKLLDQPFRFVIRGDRVRCVDVTQTLQTIR